jgi:hypothetical protein
MSLSIGSKISWTSAAGFKVGTVKNIVLAPAANDKITPWIDVEYLAQVSDMYHLRSVRLCASDSGLKGLRVTELAA